VGSYEELGGKITSTAAAASHVEAQASVTIAAAVSGSANSGIEGAGRVVAGIRRQADPLSSPKPVNTMHVAGPIQNADEARMLKQAAYLSELRTRTHPPQRRPTSAEPRTAPARPTLVTY